MRVERLQTLAGLHIGQKFKVAVTVTEIRADCIEAKLRTAAVMCCALVDIYNGNELHERWQIFFSQSCKRIDHTYMYFVQLGVDFHYCKSNTRNNLL